MKKYEIEITYSFDSSIETMGYFDTPEEAYERIGQVVAIVCLGYDCQVYFRSLKKEVDVHFSNNDWRYYRVKETYGSQIDSNELAKRIFDCLSDGYDNEEFREEAETALYNELSQIANDSFIKAAFLRLCERVEELEG